jgi:ribosomal protein S18 acetylase RimI-like enzyme
VVRGGRAGLRRQVGDAGAGLRQVPAAGARRQPGSLPDVTVQIEVLESVTPEIVAAFQRLLPQLSRSAPAPDDGALAAVVSSPAITLLVARNGGEVTGTLTLAMFPCPTGIRAWIEDVVVDEAARGLGIGEALTRRALDIAQAAGARTVDLTSRPSRAAAGRLYERVGFTERESRLYRYTLPVGS